MKPLFTFRDTAERFCEIDGRPPSDVSGVYLQVKGLFDRGLLNAHTDRGARGAHQLTMYEVCRARLLLVLIELGMESGELARANAMLEDGGRSASGTEYSLASVIAATDLQWVIRINKFRDQLEEGAVSFSVKAVPAWRACAPITDDNPDGDPTHPDTEGKYVGSTHLAYLKIPASDLIRKLVDAE